MRLNNYYKIIICLLISLAAVTGQSPHISWAASDNLIDQAGRPIKPGPYKRIISLYGAHTENLFSLGLDKEIIGVSAESDFPEAAKSKPIFSSRDNPEKFLAANPDLILVRPMHIAAHSRLITTLEHYGIEVVALQVVKADELNDYWRVLGALTNKEPEAEALINDFETRLKEITSRIENKANRPGVFIEAFNKPVKTYIDSSLPMWLLKLAGGKNIAPEVVSAANNMVGEFGLERLIAQQDNIDVYFIMNGPMNQNQPADLEGFPAYRGIKALKNKRVYILEEALVARPTPRLLLGLEKMENLLYPDLEIQSPK